VENHTAYFESNEYLIYSIMENPLKNVKEIVQVSPEELASVFTEYYEKKHSIILNEKVEASRYAVEVDFTTTLDQASHGFAKIALGYVSSCLKKLGYHCRLVFTEKPLRVIVSSRNWDDGEWIGMITYNETLGMFILSKGFYNKLDKTVDIQSKKQIDKPYSGQHMAEKLKSMMIDLKKEKPRMPQQVTINLKRGPKT
jgi:hypothetical protein